MELFGFTGSISPVDPSSGVESCLVGLTQNRAGLSGVGFHVVFTCVLCICVALALKMCISGQDTMLSPMLFSQPKIQSFRLLSCYAMSILIIESFCEALDYVSKPFSDQALRL